MGPITDPAVEDYCLRHSAPEPPVATALRKATEAQMELPQMMVGPLEGSFLRLLVRITGARRVLEIGTFTGYSALLMAEALPEDGELVTCDIDPEAAELARSFWQQSPHGKKIVQMLGDARATLGQMDGPFDLVFIDADKIHYPDYWEASLPLLRDGGILAVDNVLWSGSVLEPDSEEARVLAALNDRVQDDPRVEVVMLPLRDGLLLARKRS